MRLYRIMAALRTRYRALGSRGFFYYDDDAAHRNNGISFRRESAAEGALPGEAFVGPCTGSCPGTDRSPLDVSDTVERFPVPAG
jgi:hypothetical protein